MIGLDTNVLVRFFTEDDPAQLLTVRAFMAQLTVEEPGWVSLITLIELLWVMANKFGQNQNKIAFIVEHLLNSRYIVVQLASEVAEAVQLFKQGKADFADCLIASLAKAEGCKKTVTFDRIAARDAGMTLLGDL